MRAYGRKPRGNTACGHWNLKHHSNGCCHSCAMYLVRYPTWRSDPENPRPIRLRRKRVNGVLS